MNKVLFTRKYNILTGGHLKVWDYFNHVRSSSNYNPLICFTEDSKLDSSNPWSNCRQFVVESSEIIHPDIFFLAGLDWTRLRQQLANSSTPIINLIQGIKHSYPNFSQYDFLKNKAVRICVSQEVADAILETEQVNGPLYIIPNCLEMNKIPKAKNQSEKIFDILILAKKNQNLGYKLYEQLNKDNLHVKLLVTHIPREDFLSNINNSKTSIFLPRSDISEGFYLPALEGMALKSLVICPDCEGNRSFCLPDYNCYRPEYTMESILQSTRIGIQLSSDQREKLLSNARSTVAEHDLSIERKAFLNILENIYNIW